LSFGGESSNLLILKINKNGAAYAGKDGGSLIEQRSLLSFSSSKKRRLGEGEGRHPLGGRIKQNKQKS